MTRAAAPVPVNTRHLHRDLQRGHGRHHHHRRFRQRGHRSPTIGTVTETSPGVFTVQVTPTTAGTLQLQINASAVLNDIAGNDLDTTTPIADDTVITVRTAYDSWAGGAAFDTDNNGDGVDNGLAWLLGAAGPSDNAAGLLPVASQTAGDLVLNFTCLGLANRGAAVMKLQFSKDIGQSDSWTSHEAQVPGENDTVNGVVFVTSAHANPDLINVQATIPASAASPGGKLFSRLLATP